MRLVPFLLSSIFLAAPPGGTEDKRITQEPEACKMMWQIITAGTVKHSFESLQDPKAGPSLVPAR